MLNWCIFSYVNFASVKEKRKVEAVVCPSQAECSFPHGDQP